MAILWTRLFICFVIAISITFVNSKSEHDSLIIQRLREKFGLLSDAPSHALTEHLRLNPSIMKKLKEKKDTFT